MNAPESEGQRETISGRYFSHLLIMSGTLRYADIVVGALSLIGQHIQQVSEVLIMGNCSTVKFKSHYPFQLTLQLMNSLYTPRQLSKCI